MDVRREGVATHLLGASEELRIGERLHETIVEFAEEVELVLVRRAGGNEDPVPGGLGGGDLVCKLRLVGLDLAGIDEGHLIARLGEGVDARVERLERNWS